MKVVLFFFGSVVKVVLKTKGNGWRKKKKVIIEE